MSVQPRDEFPHEPTNGLLWRESFYANFHDAGGLTGGMVTVGTQPNRGVFEGFAVIFHLGHVLFHQARGLLDNGNVGLFSVPGIAYEVQRPLRRCRFAVDTSFVRVDPGPVALGAPLPEADVPASFEIVFDAFDSAYRFPPAYALLAGPAEHFEQNGHIRGHVVVDGEEFAIGGYGCRDRTWGIRDLSMTDHGGAIFAQFGPHRTVDVLWSRGRGQGQDFAVGYVSEGGHHIAAGTACVALKADTYGLPSAVEAEVGLENGRQLRLNAVVISAMPILWDQDGSRFYWYECLARFRSGPEMGLGVTEIAIWDRGGSAAC